MSTALVAVVALFAAAMGVWGCVSPAGLIGFVSRWRSPSRLWAAAAARLVFAAALWLAAPESRHPAVLRALALVALLAAVTIPLVGPARWEVFIDWWTRRSGALIRGWALAALAFGVYLLWTLDA